MAGRSNMPNFKTDVNRMKTQKWAQASKANYGGDDWGGYDDYDEYEEEPAPPPRPTGLRQRGQGTTNSSPDQPNFASDQISSEPPSYTSSQQAMQPPTTAQPPFQRPRAGSFESGDDSHLLQKQPNQPISHQAATPLEAAARDSNASASVNAPPAYNMSPSQPSSQTPHPSQASGHTAPPQSPYDSHRPIPSYSQAPPPPSQIHPVERAPPVIEGPYMGPGSTRSPQASHQYRPPPRQDSREAPAMMRPPQPGPGQMPPGGGNMNARPPPGTSPSYGSGRPYAQGRSASGTPPGQDPRMRREDTPPGPYGPPSGPRGRPPPPQDQGPRKRPSQEHGMRKSPSQEFRPRKSPSQEFRPRQSQSQVSQEFRPRQPPSQEFKPRQSPSQEFRPRQSPSQEFKPPPRKESLNTNQRPSPAIIGVDAPIETGSLPLQHVAERTEPPLNQEHQTEPEDGAASFVRPADIYRRVEQEREKERQSMDSARPSIDSIDRGARSNNYGPPMPRSSQDSARDGASSSQLKPKLDTVAERKSEYGMDGFLAQDPGFAKALGAQVSTGGPSLTAPSLPQLERFSGFNVDDFMGKRDELPQDSQDSIQVESQQKLLGQSQEAHTTTSIQNSAENEHQEKDEESTPVAVRPDDLQHQPSSGFRSAVDRAFDGPADQSTLSPTSGHGSQRSKDGSDMSRSNTTDSTAGISPIMSRVPSAATAERRYREAETRMAAPEVIQEEASETGSPTSRPDSSSTLKGHMPAPKIGVSHPSRPGSQDSASLNTGFRRDMRPPSPGNTPAFLTGASARKAMEQRSQEGEIAVTTPVRSSFDDTGDSRSQNATNLMTRESDIAAASQSTNPTKSQDSNLKDAQKLAQSSFIAAHPLNEMPPILSEPVMPTRSPDSRSSSPSKGRVRELATKYNDTHGSRPSSPTGSVASWASSNKGSPVVEDNSTPTAATPSVQGANPIAKDESTYSKPSVQKTADAVGLPRPTLPGGWVSYNPSEASGGHSYAPSLSDNYESANEQSHDSTSVPRLETPKVNRGPSSDSVDLTPSTAKQPLSGRSFPEPSVNPMVALGAAGAALAESVKQMSGIGQGDSSVDKDRGTRDADVSEQHTPFSPNDTITSASSMGPTPPLKDLPSNAAGQRGSGYFPAATPLTIRKNEQRIASPVEGREPDSAHSNTSGRLSLDPSASDTEADVLRKDIARTLSPPEGSQAGSKLPPINERSSNMSSVLPQEYDAYWANHSDQTAEGKTPRFSGMSFDQSTPPEVPSSPEIQDAPVTSRSARSSGFGTSSIGARSGSRPSMDSVSKPLPPDPVEKASLDSTRERREPAELDSESHGLSRLQPLQTLPPDPVEMPTTQESPRMRDVTNTSLPGSPMTGRRRADTTPTSKGQPKPPSFRDIMNIKGQRERISAFNSAKDQFGTQSTGLNEWVQHMIHKTPEHASAVSAPMRPVAQSSGIAGSMRTRMPPGMSKFSKVGTPSSTGPSDGSSPAGNYVKESPSVSRRQELLHQANVFSGKASKGAKGLLSKGKSRFRGASSEKENTQSAYPSRQRNASPTPLRNQSHSDMTSSKEHLPRAFDADVEADTTTRQSELKHSHEPTMSDANDADLGRTIQPITPHDSPQSFPQDYQDKEALPVQRYQTVTTKQLGNNEETYTPHIEPRTRPQPGELPDTIAKGVMGSSETGQGISGNDVNSSEKIPQASYQHVEVIEGRYRPSVFHQQQSSQPTVYSTEKIAVSHEKDFGARGSSMWSDKSQAFIDDTPIPSSSPARGSNSIHPLRQHPSNPSLAATSPPEQPPQDSMPTSAISPQHQREASQTPVASPMHVYEGCRDSAELDPKTERRSRFSWGAKGQNAGKSPTRMSPTAWALRARSRSSSRRNSMESPPPRPGETPPPPLPNKPPAHWQPRESSEDTRRVMPVQEATPPLPRQVSQWSTSSMSSAPFVPQGDDPPPLPAQASKWSSSSVAMAPQTQQARPVASRSASSSKPEDKPLPSMPSQLTTSMHSAHPAYPPSSSNPLIVSPISPPGSSFSPIDPLKRHYAQPPPALPSSTTTSTSSNPPSTQKTRNRLSKRHSAQVPPPAPMAEIPQSPDTGKKKRSSMFGNFLRRSETTKNDDDTLVPTNKLQPNKLKKANSKRSSTQGTSALMDAEPPPMPTSMPVTAYSQASLPRPPTTNPQLPDVDTYSVFRGQAPRQQARARSISRPRDGAKSRSTSRKRDSVSNYYEEQTPTFEASGIQFATSQSGGREQHINYLRSQDMFPSRQRSPAQPVIREQSVANYGSAAQRPHADSYNDGTLQPRTTNIQRNPSGASSIYTMGIDERMHAQPSNASSRYHSAGEYAGTRPLTGAYREYGGNPYADQIAEEPQAAGNAWERVVE